MKPLQTLAAALILLCNLALAQERPIPLVMPNSALDKLGNLPAPFAPTSMESLDGAALVDHAAAGGTLVWLGPPTNLPPELWVGHFAISDQAIALRPEPQCSLPLKNSFFSAVSSSAFILPPNEFPKHNIDEEIRADFIPLLGAYDRFGQLVGYPGVLMSHVAPSLAKNRFNGAQCYFYFVDTPQDLTEAQLSGLLDPIARAQRSGLVVERFTTDCAAYRPGDRVQLRARIRNSKPEAQALEIFFREVLGDGTTRDITQVRRVAGGQSATEATADFLVSEGQGLHTVVMEVCLASLEPEKLALTGPLLPIARREAGVVVLAQDWSTPRRVELDGPNFSVDGRPGFYAGTHYYPSNVWWEWDWRDFRPAQAARDFEGMRRAGNRMVRVWVDPVLDETVLRALDAALYLASEKGITLDVCVFNQWVRDLGFERKNGEHVQFQFRHPEDFNLYSFSLRNMDLQREYLRTLAIRWRHAGNLIYNLANETYVKNPDASQMDPEVREWEEAKLPEGTRRDTLLFRRWGEELARVVKEVGGDQPVFPGYMFSLHDGGDNYLAHETAPLETWHGYFAPEAVAQTIHYLDPLPSNRPLLLEEFGNLGWNGFQHYDAAMHYALAAGAGAAMAYEWGVSWISPEAPYVPLPMRDALKEPADPRWFTPIIDYAKQNTTEQGVGIAPWPSGFGYGSIYHGTPFPAEAAQAIWRLAMAGERFPRRAQPERVYVLAPATRPMAMEPSFPLWKSLWLQGIRFGVWHETQVDALPESAEVILLAGPVSPETQDRLKKRGALKVYPFGDTSWDADPALPRVTFSPQGQLNCLLRGTQTGTLYSFLSDEVTGAIDVRLEHAALHAGHDRFTLVHENQSGVDFIEGAGEIQLNGSLLCQIEGGRALLLSEAATPLDTADALRLVVTQPGAITFGREIRGVEVLAGAPQPAGNFEKNVLRVDDQMARYVMRLRF